MASDLGFLGATGVVGGNIPLALGSALACRERGIGQVTAVFFGDGAANVGAFHESLNIASLWRLPVLFVCENNGWAEFTPLSAHTLVERLANHAQLYRIPSITVDGNDLLAVREVALGAVGRVRAGEGPAFLECLTYRLRGHYVGDPAKYRELSELAEWKAKDPIVRFKNYLREKEQVAEEELASLERRAEERVSQAVKFALESPYPDPEEVASQVFA